MFFLDDCHAVCDCNHINVYTESSNAYGHAPQIFGMYEKSSENINGHFHYVSYNYNGTYGIWFCNTFPSWIIGLVEEKGQCKGYAYMKSNESCLLCLPNWGWRLFEGKSFLHKSRWVSYKKAKTLKIKCLKSSGKIV